MVAAFYDKDNKLLGVVHKYLWWYDEAENFAKKRLDLYKADSYEVYDDETWEYVKRTRIINHGNLDRTR